MDLSTDVKSLVRGWLQASPNIGRVKLTPPSLVPTFSPRPERLGLGAVPPRDLEAHAYNSRLEKRIRRKLSGKREGPDTAVDPLVERCLAHDVSSDEMCSRSASIHGKMTGRKPTLDSSLKTVRKRKKKKKARATISAEHSAESPMAVDCSSKCAIKEEPVLQRRQDLLRGGSQQDGDIPIIPLITGQKLLEKREKTEKKVCSESECVEKVGEVVSLSERLSVDCEKRIRKGHRCVRRRRLSLPWSSSTAWRYRHRRRHQSKRNS